MNYKVLARKYRPQTFDELVGQETLVETFKNAINHGRLAHAFLLTGIRGVGKTTTARIIAKAFNCEGKNNNKPTFNICNECKSCKSITNGNCLDVLEVDAASKTGVDNIREIIDSVMYSPNESRFKIYIIDEVHMLSTQAFNALLKTLEEPPNNSKFVFATTEIRKIPATIISRCQRFDLKRIGKSMQINHLKQISKQEKIQIDDKSLIQISESSEGSLRDALSILDQAAALMNNNINIERLIEMLGLQGYEEFYKLLNLCLKSESVAACKYYDNFIENGVSPIQIIINLLEICSKSSRYTIDETKSSFEENVHKQLTEISRFGLSHLIRAWQVLVRGFEETKNSANQIESGLMVIIKLCYSSKLPMPEELIKKINNNKITSIENIEPNKLEEKVTSDETNNEENIKNKNNYNTKIPNNTDEMLSLLIEHKEAFLHAQIINNLYINEFKPGEIKLELAENSDKDLISNLSKSLENITEIKWNIIQNKSENKVTIVNKKQKEVESEKLKILKEPIVEEILNEFPKTEIKNIQNE